MDGVVILGAEINLAGKKPEIAKATIDWDAVKRESEHRALALRVAPFAGPFRSDDAPAQAIVDLAKQLLSDARAHDVNLEEFQFDFDCAQKNLGSYRTWLLALKPIVQPTRFVITVLPAWLNDSEFRKLVREVDGYVLQVHSVPISAGTNAKLSDARLAREWVRKAARFGMPFEVALPTYRCAAGYGPDGKLLSVAMDSVQPVWPPGTRVLEFGADADEIAALVNDWQKSAAATIARINLVSRSDRNRHAQLALANIVGGHVGPSPRTQAEYFAGGREPDRFVDRQCGRGG